MNFDARRAAPFLFWMIGGLVADLWSKSAVFAWLGLPGSSPPHWLIEGVFGIQTAVNIGAVFGLGAGQGTFFAVFAIVALVGVMVWMFRFGGIESRLLTHTLGMISAGILGNLYDRLGLWTGPFESNARFDPAWHSGVRDWILFRIEGLPFFDPWPNFNLADSMLVVGAGLLMWHSYRAGDPENPNLQTIETESAPRDTIQTESRRPSPRGDGETDRGGGLANPSEAQT